MCPLCRPRGSDGRRKPVFETPNMLSAMYRATRKSNAMASSHVHAWLPPRLPGSSPRTGDETRQRVL